MEDRSRTLSVFGREVASGTTAKALSAVLKFASQIIFARFLGPSAYGSYHLLLSIVHVVDWPISGWSDAVKKRLSGGRGSSNEIVAALFVVELIFLVVIGIVGYASRGFIASYVEVDYSLSLLFLLLIHVMVFYPLLGILLSQERLAESMWIETGHALLALLLQTYLLYTGFDLVGLVVGLVVSTLITALIFRNVIPKPSMPSMLTFHSLWEYARYSSVAKLLGKGYDRFDILLIGALISPASVGYYEAASVLAAPALFSSNVVSSGIMPTVSRLESEDNEIKQSVASALRLSPFLSIPVFFGALILSEELIVTIFDPSYQQASSLLPGIALYYILKSISSPLTEIINGLDKPKYNATISAVTLLINIALGIVLGVTIGTIGIVFASVISELLRMVYLTYVVQDWGLNVLSKMHALMVVSGGLMATVVGIYKQYFPVDSVFDVVFVVGFGAIVYISLMFSLSQQLRKVVMQFRSGDV